MSDLDEASKIGAEEIARSAYKKAGIEITAELEKSIKDRAEKLLEDSSQLI